MNCRHCFHQSNHTVIDLGFSPPSNAYLGEHDLTRPEKYYPLRVRVCDKCWLVQTEDYPQASELFSHDYAYFSSTSKSWLKHAEDYTKKVIKQFNLGGNSLVIEIASNDGYLLKNFVAANIPCLGIEPTEGTSIAAEKLGIPVLREFFGSELGEGLAKSGRQADLIIGNNVYAHVPNINDFTQGLKLALKSGGVITLEFPHLMRLIEHTQFDTMYHEHFSYLALHVVMRIFSSVGLRIFDVDELPTHGGSLRVYGCHNADARETNDSVNKLLEKELSRGLEKLSTYQEFQNRADQIKDDLLRFLIEQKHAGKKIAAYGAAAKGNTLVNYAGIKPDLLPMICDASSSKQGKFMPGSHIPILSPEMIRSQRPDYVLILPWNIKQEVCDQLRFISDWGGKFVIAIPKLEVI